jgi:hypothetical protein
MMKKRLSVRELFHNSWKSFIENIMDWLFVYGMQCIAIVSFFLCCSILLALVHYFFIDLCLFECALSGYSKFFTVSMISIVSLFTTFFFIAFPIMYRQNALDCVFNRPLSGFDVNNRFFSYAVAMFFYWIITACASLFFIIPGLLLAQRWRFVGLYLLDHGGNVRRAFRASWVMTRGYSWFLVGISMMQWLLFLFCGSTIVLIIVAMVMNRLIDANMYKLLHMEFDKDLAICSCEA